MNKSGGDKRELFWAAGLPMLIKPSKLSSGSSGQADVAVPFNGDRGLETGKSTKELGWMCVDHVAYGTTGLQEFRRNNFEI